MILNHQGIRAYRAIPGSIRENIAAAKEGTLQEITPADSCGGHDHGDGSCHH